MNKLGSVVVAGVALLGVGCDTASAPTSFGVNCPLSQLVFAPGGQPVRATYAAPIATGGTAPVNVRSKSPTRATKPL